MMVGKRIKFVRKYLGLGGLEFAKLMGITQGLISLWESGKREPGLSYLTRISELSGCSLDWLVAGKGKYPFDDSLVELADLNESVRFRYLREKVLKCDLNSLSKKIDVSIEKLERYDNGEKVPSEILLKICNLANIPLSLMLARPESPYFEFKAFRPRIPVIASIPAGLPTKISANEIIDWIGVWDDALRGKDVFAIKVTGNSMEPKLFDGDYVIVIVQPTANNHDIIVARLNDEVIIKEYIKKEKTISLLSYNPDYPVITVSSKDDFKIIGVVYGIGLRRLRK